MNPLTVQLVAEELDAAEEALSVAMDGPAAAEEADAIDRLRRALELTKALLRTVPADPGTAPALAIGDPILWLHPFGDELHVSRGHIVAELPQLSEHKRYAAMIEPEYSCSSTYRIAAEAPYLIRTA